MTAWVNRICHGNWPDSASEHQTSPLLSQEQWLIHPIRYIPRLSGQWYVISSFRWYSSEWVSGNYMKALHDLTCTILDIFDFINFGLERNWTRNLPYQAPSSRQGCKASFRSDDISGPVDSVHVHQIASQIGFSAIRRCLRIRAIFEKY